MPVFAKVLKIVYTPIRKMKQMKKAEHSLQCPMCKRTYDRSWRVCLFCSVPLEDYDESSEKDTGFEHFPGTRSEIVAFSVIIMVLTPIMIALLYLSYLEVLDMGYIRHKIQQLKEAVVFHEEEEEEDDEYYRR